MQKQWQTPSWTIGFSHEIATWSGQGKAYKNEDIMQSSPTVRNRLELAGSQEHGENQVNRRGFALQRVWSRRPPRGGCQHPTWADPQAQHCAGHGGMGRAALCSPTGELQSQSWKPGSRALQICGTFSDPHNPRCGWLNPQPLSASHVQTQQL